MRYLLDTNIISALARNPHGPARERVRAAGPGEILTSIVVLGELTFGLTKNPSAKRERQVADILEGIEIADLEPEVARHYGALRADLERAGAPISANDYWIAAHALALDCTLVTANEREFRRVPGLKVENWLA